MNVSAHEFRDEFLPAVVESALKQHPSVAPQALKLELTEGRSMSDPVSSIEQMKQLSEKGVEIWIDDFGTGHSSLSYLKQLPATALKIDRGLVEGVEERESDRAYISGIVASIRARGKTIVVEGVMNAEQARIMADLGCEYLQGYYYARPMDAAGFEHLLDHGIEGVADPARQRRKTGNARAAK